MTRRRDVATIRHAAVRMERGSMVRSVDTRWLAYFGVALIAAATVGPLVLHAQDRAPLLAERSGAPILRERVTLNVRNAALDNVLSTLREQMNGRLMYAKAIIKDDAEPVTYKATQAPIGVVLRDILAGRGIIAYVTGRGDAVVLKSADSTVVGGMIVGRVTDSAGRAKAGVVVRVEGERMGSVTNAQGAYVLHGVPGGSRQLSFRLLGHRPELRTITVVEGESRVLMVVLVPSAAVLDQVVTTGDGSRKRLEVGNDITTINADSVMKTAPIHTVTDLLEHRVPGLVVTRSSGAAGAPARLRLRGINSASMSNDPIVILNGIRVQGPNTDDNHVTPLTSRLDDIDPTTIETIEVLKGPSAATLYGTDAANGVIVITTKRGQVGVTNWTFGYNQAWENIPGTFPPVYASWGHGPDSNESGICSQMYYILGICTVQDSVSRSNVLADPGLSSVSPGHARDYHLSMSTGSQTLQFFAGGSYSDILGPMKFPNAVRDLFRAANSGTLPSWALHPNTQQSFSANTQMTLQPTRTSTVAWTVTGAKLSTRNNGNGISDARNAILLTASDTQSYIHSLMGVFGSRTDQDVVRAASGVNGHWQPKPWWESGITAGIDHSSSQDETYHIADTTATFGNSIVNTRSAIETYSLSGSSGLQVSVASAVRFRTGVGAQYVRNNGSGTTVIGQHLPDGNEDVASGGTTSGSSFESESATFGTYLNEDISLYNRLFLSVGVRRDAGSAFGSNIHAPLYPKFNASYLVWSDPPAGMPAGLISNLRLRTAYGHSAVQPSWGASLAQYKQSTAWYDGAAHPVLLMTGLGNSLLEPERSVEIEGGFDAGLLANRVQVSATMFRKRSRDALIDQSIAPSAGSGGTRQENVGSVVNAGSEVSINARILDSRLLSWDFTVEGSGTRNKLVALGPNVTSLTPIPGQRLQPGYPLYGVWTTPFYGYIDRNHDGLLDPNEMLFGDSVVNVGWPQPRYSLNYSSSVGLFNGMLRLNATVSYDNGVTQQINNAFQRVLNDRNATYNEQVAAYRDGIQTVAVTRFSSLGITYTVPSAFVRYFRGKSATVSLFGSNLGLWTQYSGIDPGVNTAGGEGLKDEGTIPQTRNWSLNFSLQY